MSSISSSRAADLVRLERRLAYQFTNRALLEQALTHKSHSRQHNERLEFLGDAVLGYVIADLLYADPSNGAEDALTITRADLVRGDTLAVLARRLGLGDFLRLGSGERKSGGRDRTSILADALEAVIGAISLDGGLEAARACIGLLYAEELVGLGDRRVSKDAKTRLQERLQGEALALPSYAVVSEEGSDHERTFTVSCAVPELELTALGRGRSRRAAEKAAAQALLDLMEVPTP
ncbi:MAG: ribonuclease III [Pseudomonadota bacterium]